MGEVLQSNYGNSWGGGYDCTPTGLMGRLQGWWRDIVKIINLGGQSGCIEGWREYQGIRMILCFGMILGFGRFHIYLDLVDYFI